MNTNGNHSEYEQADHEHSTHGIETGSGNWDVRRLLIWFLVSFIIAGVIIWYSVLDYDRQLYLSQIGEEDIDGFIVRMEIEIDGFRNEVKAEINSLETKLNSDIMDLQSDIRKRFDSSIEKYDDEHDGELRKALAQAQEDISDTIENYTSDQLAIISTWKEELEQTVHSTIELAEQTRSNFEGVEPRIGSKINEWFEKSGRERISEQTEKEFRSLLKKFEDQYLPEMIKEARKNHGEMEVDDLADIVIGDLMANQKFTAMIQRALLATYRTQIDQYINETIDVDNRINNLVADAELRIAKIWFERAHDLAAERNLLREKEQPTGGPYPSGRSEHYLVLGFFSSAYAAERAYDYAKLQWQYHLGNVPEAPVACIPEQDRLIHAIVVPIQSYGRGFELLDEIAVINENNGDSPDIGNLEEIYLVEARQSYGFSCFG